MNYYSVIGNVAKFMSSEMAHNAAVYALKCGLVPSTPASKHASLNTQLFGIDFPNPVGLAAGFDKNAEAVDALFNQGFGFVEAGTVTPLPQPGNPKPRIFRLEQDEAVINRLGFNSKGLHVFVENLKKRKKQGILGANISKNKDSLDALYDYSTTLTAVYDLVDYITINISSPNTVGLRDLQQKEALSSLILSIEKKRVELALSTRKRKPILYKIAPDLTSQDKEDIAEVALAHNLDGLIITNTTVSRPADLQSFHASERGGLSGKPLFALSTATLRDMYRLCGGKIPLIGVGGISSAEDAYAKICAGASLVQLYTGLVYKGFGLVKEINDGLARLLQRDGFEHVKDAVGKAI